MLGSKIVYETLLKNNVKHIFGYSGGAILPVLNELYGQDKIKFIMSRTELGGSFMAEGYSKTNKYNNPGVIMTTSGPGALNIITSLQNSYSDGTPLLALCGQVSTEVLGTNAFQEADVINISKPCTKWNRQIKDGNLINIILNLGFQNIYNQRHGPVLIDLPKNIMNAKFEPKFTCYISKFSDFERKSNICPKQIIKLILNSRRPVILAGQGVLQSKSSLMLNLFAKKYNIPVTTTLMGLGSFNEKDSLSLKMLGMHGSFAANMAIQNSDLLLNFGSRFDDRIIGNPQRFAKRAKIIHIDILEKNINKTIKSDFYINDNCQTVLCELLQIKGEKDTNKENINFQEWHDKIKSWKIINFSYPERKNVIQGRHVISLINKIIHKDKIHNYTIVADVGAHQMWTAQFIDYCYPKVKFLTSGGLGSMGFALPASIGVKIGDPDEKVICICGDGGFTMSMVEIITAVNNKINVKIFVINNNYQLMVKMWQEMFYDNRIIGTDMNNPNFEKICESMGCKSLKIDSNENIEQKIFEILNYEEGPIVANIITTSDEAVLPMVIPGASLDNMVIHENKKQKYTGDAPC